jgi:uncharacterized membrane protein YbaN (DUF454 family)
MGLDNERLRTDQDEAGADGPWPRMTADEPSGVLRVRDPRVFRAEGRAFCRRWLAATLGHPEVRKAGIDLATATAVVEFESCESSTATMAAIFAEAVREALGAPASAPDDRSRWVALTGFAGPDSQAWEVSRRSTDRLELHPPALDTARPRRADWLGRVAGADGVTGCRSAWFSDALTVAYDPARTNEDRVLEAVRLAWRESSATGTGTGTAIDPRHRTMNLVKAGGSFALTLVGIVVPGIPTIPFLLGTSYYLARSSPTLNRRLLQSPIFGQVLREWEQYQALSPSSKAKLLGLSAAILTITVLTIPINPIALIPILLISLASVYATLQIPGLPALEGEKPRIALALG